jgi:putative transposase
LKTEDVAVDAVLGEPVSRPIPCYQGITGNLAKLSDAERAWVSQQLREAFPFDAVPKYLIFDRSSNFNDEVISTIKSFGIEPKRTSFRSPWQNGVAERFVGSSRRDLLNHVIVLNEQHLKRLMAEYVHYCHDDRTHLGLEKQTPAKRLATSRNQAGKIAPSPLLGCLHHRYDVAA